MLRDSEQFLPLTNHIRDKDITRSDTKVLDFYPRKGIDPLSERVLLFWHLIANWIFVSSLDLMLML